MPKARVVLLIANAFWLFIYALSSNAYLAIVWSSPAPEVRTSTIVSIVCS